MRILKHELDGQTYYLAYNIAAMLSIDEIGNIGKIIEKPELCVKVFSVLAEQGELVRRFYGHDTSFIPSENYLKTHVSPGDIFDMQGAVIKSVTLGLKREVEDEDNKVIDLSLQKIEKKTGPE